MSQTVANLGKKAIALLILLVAAWLLFKVVVGLVTSVVWFIVAALAVIAIIWAVRTL